MSERVTISTIGIGAFGGLNDLRLDLPDAPLVVIAGQNQAGKSTIAEALMWTLVGPRGAASHAHRYGEPSSVLDARVGGFLGDRPFALRSTFRVLASRGPKVGSFVAELDGQAIDRPAWLGQLGSLGVDGLHAVHRLDGVDGHEVQRAGEVLDLASAGMLGGVDPGPAAGRLREAARLLATSRAGGLRSVAQLADLRTEVRAALDEAEVNAERYVEVQRDLAELRGRKVAGADALAGARLQQQHAALALAAIGTDVEIRQLRSDLRALPEVPDAWQVLLGDLDGLRREVAFERDELPALQHTIAVAEASAARVGLPIEALAALEIDDEALTSVASLHRDHGAAQVQLEEAEASAARSAAARDAVAAEAEAVVRLVVPDGERAALRSLAVPDPARATAVATALRRVEDLRREVQERRTPSALAASTLAAARDHASDVDAAWERFQTGGSAEQYLRAQYRPQESMERRPMHHARWVLPALGALVVAGLALAVGQVALAIGSLVVAVACTLAGWPPRAVASPGDHHALADAALAVIDADRARRVAEDGDRLAARERSSVVAALDAACVDLWDQLVGAGVPAVVLGGRESLDPAVAAESWTQWSVARSKLLELDAATTRAAAAAAAVHEARRSLAVTTSELRSRLRTVGLPDGVGVADAAAALRSIRTAAGEAQAAAVAAEDIVRHRGDVAARCATVAVDGVPLDLRAIGVEAERLDDIDRRRRVLAEQIGRRERDRAAQIGGSAGVQRLLDACADADELAAHAQRIDGIVDDAQASCDATATEIGRAEQVAATLAEQSEVAELSHEMAQLDEEIAEASLAAVARSIAAQLIEEEAARERRERQPDLIRRTSDLACGTIESWRQVRVERSARVPGSIDLVVDQVDGATLRSEVLSTGARAVLYLALRAAVADEQSGDHGLRLPLVCDDPLVHLDDDVATNAVRALAQISSGRQVIVFTCHERTVRAAARAGAAVVQLSGHAIAVA